MIRVIAHSSIVSDDSPLDKRVEHGEPALRKPTEYHTRAPSVWTVISMAAPLRISYVK